MIVRPAFLAAAFLALAACAAAPAGGIVLRTAGEKTGSKHVAEANFIIGEQRTAVVGESIVRLKDFRQTETVRPSLRARSDGHVIVGADRIDILNKETVPLADGEDGSRYAVIGEAALLIRADGRVTGQVFQMTGYGTFIDQTATSTITPSDLVFEPAERVLSSMTPEGENYEIVFTGRDAASLRFQFREYTSDDMARAAFSQDLTYPVTASTIRFRNLTIAINEVGADSLSYRVVARDSKTAD